MEVEELYKAAQIEDAISDPEIAHLILDGNQVAGLNGLPGLMVEPEPTEDGVYVEITLEEGTVIEKPVHLCFGLTQGEGVQNIEMDIDIGKNAEIGILSHCVFPRATDVKHYMDSEIRVGEGAEYNYLEKHVHSSEGDIEVVPRAKAVLEENSRFKTDFELIEGRVGRLDIDYDTICKKDSVLEMSAKVDGRKDDVIKISESGSLEGEGSRGVLTTRVALREEAEAEVYNELSASSPYARGHVDCKEIVQDDSSAKAIPIVEVNHPQAHVTHEAAIGSVDKKQLETLMSRGLSEEEGVDLIIDGLLS